MTSKMLAAVVEQFGQPLVLRDWDMPSPGPGQVVVKTEACGVCHTDLHAARGDWPIRPTPPFIPGHEAIGLVVLASPSSRKVTAWVCLGSIRRAGTANIVCRDGKLCAGRQNLAATR